jgi:epoxyqueuosine reductase QueG
VGVVGRERWDAVAPPAVRLGALHDAARSIVVIGSAGRAHFDAFLAWVAVDPVRRLARERDPMDAFAADVMNGCGEALRGCRVVHPTFYSDVKMDFMKLAELAGIGRRSELGILVSPTVGPWFGLRAAVLTPEVLPETGLGVRACDACEEKPCLVPLTPIERRSACVVGREWKYSDAAMLYHYDRPAGRRWLCERFGVADESGL